MALVLLFGFAGFGAWCMLDPRGVYVLAAIMQVLEPLTKLMS